MLDPNQRGIANTKPVARDISHGFARQAVTDASGFYTLTKLAPSTYEVSASANGFAAATAQEIRVEVNSRVRLDVGLGIVGRAETVEVRAQA